MCYAFDDLPEGLQPERLQARREAYHEYIDAFEEDDESRRAKGKKGRQELLTEEIASMKEGLAAKFQGVDPKMMEQMEQFMTAQMQATASRKAEIDAQLLLGTMIRTNCSGALAT